MGEDKGETGNNAQPPAAAATATAAAAAAAPSPPPSPKAEAREDELQVGPPEPVVVEEKEEEEEEDEKRKVQPQQPGVTADTSSVFARRPAALAAAAAAAAAVSSTSAAAQQSGGAPTLGDELKAFENNRTTVGAPPESPGEFGPSFAPFKMDPFLIYPRPEVASGYSPRDVMQSLGTFEGSLSNGFQTWQFVLAGAVMDESAVVSEAKGKYVAMSIRFGSVAVRAGQDQEQAVTEAVG